MRLAIGWPRAAQAHQPHRYTSFRIADLQDDHPHASVGDRGEDAVSRDPEPCQLSTSRWPWIGRERLNDAQDSNLIGSLSPANLSSRRGREVAIEPEVANQIAKRARPLPPQPWQVFRQRFPRACPTRRPVRNA